ncbi:MAG TPA: response regulator [Steroidobacteraceae bacterium]|jgi:CheY-like chemotaxis protein
MLIQRPDEHADATEVTAEGTRQRRILVVDDNRDAADSLAMLLEVEGHVTRTAGDGPAALEAIAQFAPELVLLDIGLPGMNGYDVARAIREKDDLRGITLVALTGWGQPEDRLRSRASGFDAHLVKPVDFETLHALLGGITRMDA